MAEFGGALQEVEGGRPVLRDAGAGGGEYGDLVRRFRAATLCRLDDEPDAIGDRHAGAHEKKLSERRLGRHIARCGALLQTASRGNEIATTFVKTRQLQAGFTIA